MINLEKYRNENVYRKCFSLIDLTSLNHTDTAAKIESMTQKVNEFSKNFPDIQNVAAIAFIPILQRLLNKT